MVKNAGSVSASEDDDMAAAWEDNWDDDTVEEDFAVQLVRFTRKRAHSPPLRSPSEEQPAAKKRCSRSSPMQVDNGNDDKEDQQVNTQVRWIYKQAYHLLLRITFELFPVPTTHPCSIRCEWITEGALCSTVLF